MKEINFFLQPLVLEDDYLFSGVGGRLVQKSCNYTQTILKDYNIQDVSLHHPLSVNSPDHLSFCGEQQ